MSYHYRNNDGLENKATYSKDGVYKLPVCYKEGTQGTRVSFVTHSMNEVTITQLPSAYEGALVFDGVDDCAYVDNFDTLIDGDEFTTIGYYEVLPQGNKSSYNLYARSSNANWSRIETPSITTPSYGKRSYTVNYTSNTSSYDILEGESFKMDKAYKVFPKKFSLNGWFNEANNYLFGISKVAHYWVAIYKGKLTPEEIETEKERLNEEWLKRTKVTIPKPDVYYDMSLKDNSSPTRNIIDDLSGNGHDAEIFNAAYALGSGYGKYDIDMSKFVFDKGVASFDIASTKVVITNISNRERLFYNQKAFASYNIRISNLKGNELGIIHFDEQGKEIKSIITEDGTYTVPENHFTVSYAWSGISATNKTILGDCDIVVELLPAAYQGAFVFDGVDDYAIMQNVTKGFKTVFLDIIPSLTRYKGSFMFNQVLPPNIGISSSLERIAYNQYNEGGVTYINGKLNTTKKGKEVNYYRQIITMVNGNVTNPREVTIDVKDPAYMSNMALYKLIGFYDELTPLQIEKVINDYKLKYD